MRYALEVLGNQSQRQRILYELWLSAVLGSCFGAHDVVEIMTFTAGFMLDGLSIMSLLPSTL